MTAFVPGERQTVDRARHPELGLGFAVRDNGPSAFVADSGEVVPYASIGGGGATSSPKASWLNARSADGAIVKLDVTGLPRGKTHRRIVTVGGVAGWLTEWFDDFGWCHEFQPDDGEIQRFAASAAWVGGPKDRSAKKWPLPAPRDRQFSLATTRGTFSFWREGQEPKGTPAAVTTEQVGLFERVAPKAPKPSRKLAAALKKRDEPARAGREERK